MDHRGRIPGRVIEAVDVYCFTRLVAVVVARVCVRHDVLISFEVQHIRIEMSEAFLPSRSSLKFSRRFLEEGRRPMASDYRKLRSWQFSFLAEAGFENPYELSCLGVYRLFAFRLKARRWAIA